MYAGVVASTKLLVYHIDVCRSGSSAVGLSYRCDAGVVASTKLLVYHIDVMQEW